MIPAAPLVANAVEDAVGIRLKEMPLTAEKILLAMKGIDFNDVKGEYMGLCFMDKPKNYRFEVGGVPSK